MTLFTVLFSLCFHSNFFLDCKLQTFNKCVIFIYNLRGIYICVRPIIIICFLICYVVINLFVIIIIVIIMYLYT